MIVDSTLPHLTLQYTPSEQQELAFHFTRKATRPDYTRLNPFTSPIDHQTFEQGNPLLRPRVSNRAEINYSFVGGKDPGERESLFHFHREVYHPGRAIDRRQYPNAVLRKWKHGK